MSLIKVDPEELLTTAAHIEAAIAIGDDCRSKNGVLAGEAAAAGRGDVESAISSFMSTWSYGLEYINKDGETLASYLKAAGGAYEKAEAAVARAATP